MNRGFFAMDMNKLENEAQCIAYVYGMGLSDSQLEELAQNIFEALRRTYNIGVCDGVISEL
jgi:hypothetical protein